MSKKCDECKRCAINDDMTNVVMSSADWQRNEQRHLRREKRLVWLIAFLIAALICSNIGWIICESQFEVVEETTETYEIVQESSETNNSIINGGEIVNGETND